MLLQYQTLTQGSDPKEQPLGSLAPLYFFHFLPTLVLHNGLEYISGPPLSRWMWGRLFLFLFLFTHVQKPAIDWVVHKEMVGDFLFQNILSFRPVSD
ncbi:hypothetical protein AVEN_110294-1 [Araneus ventricosus]|uniref:Uncharacterized protein n=1 Tax=Araneus ventricosus TaxID=182803 RepID=A0A4Y2DP88_ARAVE|nr:hypothetical protein AVEN_110294-1 [Araneus ventricosus]